MQSRGVLTLAFGNPKYTQTAKALARSLILHDPTLPRAIVTDSADPELAVLFTHRIELRPEYGSDARQKLYLDLYSPFEETLFLDSDSLAIRNLDVFWSAFRDLPFGVCGDPALHGGDAPEPLDIPSGVDSTLSRLSPTAMPRFNPGLYYFKRSPEATAIFAAARELLRQSSDQSVWRFHSPDRRIPDRRIRDRRTANRGLADCCPPNRRFRSRRAADRHTSQQGQAFFSIAMALHDLTTTDFGSGGIATPSDVIGPLTIDISRGICTFVQSGRRLKPDILHLALSSEIGCSEAPDLLRELPEPERRRLGIGSLVATGIGCLAAANDLRLKLTSLWTPKKPNSLSDQIHGTLLQRSESPFRPNLVNFTGSSKSTKALINTDDSRANYLA